ncbi:hypothetical protein [Leifsonia shinshuensis]|uniref:Uncharacterized protein n=1 Tax=Leifsonia shinshuensis TaxID=150026 RepID=A0A7G6YA53_9MICO|nr:hypothetical protein [Leifsonia shinshuensis]QNE35368.1 hypothetical protein F1C12_09660 [Leifsonia shinshuensis]
MTDERDEELEQRLREALVPAADNDEATAAFTLPPEAMRQHIAEVKGKAADAGAATAHVAAVLRTTQPTKVAPEEWLGQVLEVVTEAGSRYVIDTIDWTLQRVRGRDDQEDPEVAPASTLRRDGETLRLLRVIRLEVGRPAVFDVEPLRPDALWTRRTTTFLVEIRRVTDVEDTP